MSIITDENVGLWDPPLPTPSPTLILYDSAKYDHLNAMNVTLIMAAMLKPYFELY